MLSWGKVTAESITDAETRLLLGLYTGPVIW